MPLPNRLRSQWVVLGNAASICRSRQSSLYDRLHGCCCATSSSSTAMRQKRWKIRRNRRRFSAPLSGFADRCTAGIRIAAKVRTALLDGQPIHLGRPIIEDNKISSCFLVGSYKNVCRSFSMFYNFLLNILSTVILGQIMLKSPDQQHGSTI